MHPLYMNAMHFCIAQPLLTILDGGLQNKFAVVHFKNKLSVGSEHIMNTNTKIIFVSIRALESLYHQLRLSLCGNI